MKIFNSENKWFRFLLVILFIHLISNIFWIVANNAPMPWDPASHTYIAYQIADNITSFKFDKILDSSNYYPIFVHSISAFLILIVRPFIENVFIQIKLVQFMGTLFFLGTVYMVFAYARLLIKQEKIAFFSAALFSLFPIIYGNSHFFMLDIPAIGMFLLTLFFLEKSKALTQRRWTLWFFISCGFLFMTKWTGLLYLLVPFLSMLFIILKQGIKRNHLYDIFIGIVLFLLISFPWYSLHAQDLLKLTGIYSIGEIGGDPQELFAIDNLTFYSQAFINYQATFIGALAFFLFLPFAFRAYKNQMWILTATILANYILFTFIGNKDSRYTMQILPLVAIVIALGISQLKKLPNYLVTCVLFLYLGLNFLVLTFRPALTEGAYTFIKLPFLERVHLFNITDDLVTKYDTHTWVLDSLLKDLTMLSNKNKITVYLGVEYMNLNPSTFSLYLKASKLDAVSILSPDITYLLEKYGKEKFPNETEIARYLAQADYALVSPQGVGYQFVRNKSALEQLRFYVNGEQFPDCSNYQLTLAPTKSSCIVNLGEKMKSASDIIIDDGPVLSGEKTIEGFATVYCEWGCSFFDKTGEKISQKISTNHIGNYMLLRNYFLPDGNKLSLFKIVAKKIF